MVGMLKGKRKDIKHKDSWRAQWLAPCPAADAQEKNHRVGFTRVSFQQASIRAQISIIEDHKGNRHREIPLLYM